MFFNNCLNLNIFCVFCGGACKICEDNIILDNKNNKVNLFNEYVFYVTIYNKNYIVAVC